jgi:nickel-dependent lactate racemase
MCARALVNHPVIVYCSGISRGDLERMFFRQAESAQEAVDSALRLKGPDARVLVLPHAVDCVPQVISGEEGG